MTIDVEVDSEKTEFRREQMLEAYILRALNLGGDWAILGITLNPERILTSAGTKSSTESQVIKWIYSCCADKFLVAVRPIVTA